MCPFCNAGIEPTKFACRKHWFELTAAEREEVQAAYQDYKAGDSVNNLRRRQQAVIDSASPRIRGREEEYRSAAGIAPKPKDADGVFGKCRACNAPIFFATTENEQTIPIDANPVADGTMYKDGNVMKVRSMFNVPLDGTPLYKTHFATCTDPKRFRGKGKKK